MQDAGACNDRSGWDDWSGWDDDVNRSWVADDVYPAAPCGASDKEALEEEYPLTDD